MGNNGVNFTPRELEALSKLAEGKLHKNIAAELGITDYTLKNHLTNVYRKLHLDDRELSCCVAAARWYWERYEREAVTRCNQKLGVFPPRADGYHYPLTDGRRRGNIRS